MASKVESLIQEFIVSLRAAIAEEAAQAFMIAGGGTVPQVGRSSASKAPRANTAKRAAPKAKGAKRTADEMAGQSDQILSYLKKNPAQGAEQLGAALGLSTAELALPIKQLIAKKALKFVGQKRGRKYSAR